MIVVNRVRVLISRCHKAAVISLNEACDKECKTHLNSGSADSRSVILTCRQDSIGLSKPIPQALQVLNEPSQ
jgi:hypothetical protein